MPPSDAIDVLLVCRPEVLRLGMERLLAQARGLNVTALAELPDPGARAAVCLLAERGLRDLAAACQAARELADEIVVVLRDADVHLMLDCVAAGACGFVLEGDGATELTAAVRAAARGEHFVTPALLGPLLEMHRAERAGPRDADRELLQLLAGGRGTAEIAAALGVTPKTLRNRSSQLYKRLGVRSRAQAIEVAERRGLLD